MKRWISLLLALCLLFSLAACSKPAGDQAEKTAETQHPSQGVTSDDSQSVTSSTVLPEPTQETDAPVETEKPLPELPPADGSTTLMVYLMGSDLESKTGAGTNDLTEISESGIDLDACTVLVYAGGSAHWHTDLTDETQTTILRLTPEGFEALEHMDARSMGEPETLTAFLEHCVDLAPADHYALILWDHGNGPVIGYGKDTLYKNDSLTLSEMRQAMEASPFGGDLRLDWVGFDACLMASAELACIWADYADYIVASQEVEPSFGWAYNFLRGLGRQPTEELMDYLTEYYLDACLDYYEKKGYSDRDTTLACLKLSAVPQLESAMDGLFSAMAADVAVRYDELAASRVDTRALGRTSTGSEYDLVDLEDLAARMTEFYPEQGAALTAAIQELVLVNVTNSERLGGLSLYYPFFNKDYYREKWADIYTELGLFPAYQAYLSAYTENWLMFDLPIDAAQSLKPTQLAKQTFTLQLSPEEAASFAAARYYILKQEGDEAFTRIYSSDDVTLENGLLTANFDGNVIYAVSDYGKVFLPVTIQYDTVGSVTRYGVNTTLTNTNEYGMFEQPEGFEDRRSFCRFLLNLDHASGEVTVSALRPVEENPGTALTGGKDPEPDLSEWTTYVFPEAQHCTLGRYPNGLVRPIDEWMENSVISYSEFPILQGLRFLWRPLSGGRYALIFEIRDTHDNRYCSEPLSIDVEGKNWFGELERQAPDPISGEWNGSPSEAVLDFQGVRMYLQTEEDFWSDTTSLAPRMVNNSGRDLNIRCYNLLLNGETYCDDGFFGSFTLNAGQESVGSANYGDAVKTGAVDRVETIGFSMTITDCATRELLATNQWVQIKLNQPWEPQANKNLDLHRITEPYCGAAAEEQVLYDGNGIRFTLHCFGTNPDSNYPTQAAITIENSGQDVISLRIDGLQINDLFVPTLGPVDTITSYPGTKNCRTIFLDPKMEALFGITDVNSLGICVRAAYNTMEIFQGYGQVFWLPVTLSQASGRASSLETGDRILYENDSVRISIESGDENAYGQDNYSQIWNLIVENKTDEGLSYRFFDKAVNGVKLKENDYSITSSENRVGPHQKTVWPVTLYFGSTNGLSGDNPAREISFRILFQNYSQSVDLWQTEQAVTLTPP